ncbi:MAG: NlpC/P60 family protein [Devosia sp.]
MTREDIVDAARLWLGTPYRHRTSTLGAGCDCLGLLRGVWRALYGGEPMTVPNYRASWRDAAFDDQLQRAAETLLVRAEGQARAGQVVLFKLQRAAFAKHCGIMVSPARFIHAQEHLGVVEANMTEGWMRRVDDLYDLPGVGD